MPKQLWFKAKRYGWGWYPATWQGWFTMFVWVVLFTVTMPNVPVVIILTIVLIVICYKTGEKPGWRWGGKK